MNSKSRKHNSAYKLSCYRVRRQMLVNQLGGKCAICGSTENLEFDHINSNDKSFNISRHLSYSLSKIQPELEKCQLLCHNCHTLKSDQLRDTNAKIDINIANSIRAEYACTGVSQQALGEKYGLTQSAVGRIVRGEQWKDEFSVFKKDEIIKHPSGIAVDQIDPVTGKIIKTYENMKAVEKDGFKSSMVSKCCSGKGKHHGGFVWKKH